MLGNIITDQFLAVGDIPFGSAIAVVADGRDGGGAARWPGWLARAEPA